MQRHFILGPAEEFEVDVTSEEEGALFYHPRVEDIEQPSPERGERLDCSSCQPSDHRAVPAVRSREVPLPWNCWLMFQEYGQLQFSRLGGIRHLNFHPGLEVIQHSELTQS